MSHQRMLAVLTMFVWLAGCGSAEKPPPPVEESVFRDVAVTPLEKAKNVENVVMEQKRATDRAVERNESDQ
jgi:hypothetical protein